jgi:hypothetical protein
MPIIGNPIYQSAFVVDQFSGNGSTVAFTMSVAPAGVTNVLVAVSGVLQDPSTYGVVGNTITFSAAPPSGTGNISCRYLGVPVTGVTTTAYRTVTEFTATASQTTFTPPSYNVGFINVYLNGVLLGSADYTASNGTTVVLATGAAAGNLVTVESFLVSSVLNAIPNTAGSISLSGGVVTGILPIAKGGTGTSIGTYQIQALVVGGGGGGGTRLGGGGGGGGFIYLPQVYLNVGTVYSVTVGAGGAGGTSDGNGATGSNSVFGSYIAYGGGGGAGQNNTGGLNGGSGGGGMDGEGSFPVIGGSPILGQGSNGGSGIFGSGRYLGGGGGGAGGGGRTAFIAASSQGGNGGAGQTSSITGSSVTYAGGGGGAAYSDNGSTITASTGGAGGGGAGAGQSGDGTAGTANTGGGGGGGSFPSRVGGAGGSGVVVLSVPTANYSGTTTGSPTITTSGSNTVIRFTASGSYTA